MTEVAPHKESGLRIEICGNIASGKTTLAHALTGIGAQTNLEDFIGNPFWSHFYKDPMSNAFETELGFLLHHFFQVKHATPTSLLGVSDFSFLLDLAYARTTLDSNKLLLFSHVLIELVRSLRPPALIIYLVCSPKEALRRIRLRGRSAEGGIDLAYLSRLGSNLDDIVNSNAGQYSFLIINSESIDFATDAEAQSVLLRQIESELNKLSKANAPQ